MLPSLVLLPPLLTLVSIVLIIRPVEVIAALLVLSVALTLIEAGSVLLRSGKVRIEAVEVVFRVEPSIEVVVLCVTTSATFPLLGTTILSTIL